MKIVTDSSRKDRVMNERFSFDRGEKKEKERSGERIVYNLTSVRQILNPTYYMQMSHEEKEWKWKSERKWKRKSERKRKKDKKRMNESICVTE